MRDIALSLQQWLRANERIAVATIVWAEGSSPRGPGARLAVTASGQVAGSVSGGCLEGTVFKEAQDVLLCGKPRHLHYSATEADVWEVGLACGGTIDIYVEPFSEVHCRVVKTLANHGVVALATDLEDGGHWAVWPDGCSAGDSRLQERIAGLLPAWAGGISQSSEVHVLDKPDGSVFLDIFAAPPTIVVIGAVHVAMPLVRMAQTMGFRVRVIDARKTFLTRERFPTAEELVLGWPQDVLRADELGPQHYIVVLSHDAKFDVPALRIALQSDAAYVGLIGSRQTQIERREALSEQGLGDEMVSRIYGPIGLDLGGRSPAGIALAILAEIVAVQHGRPGRVSIPA